ncbi:MULTISPECIES: class I SAM-dependent methyltransferase [unclassified Jeotgalibaca]|uniref:class I SAM-dependent methyltransferase n=1 Tax=unclassified Jeotgalibaca TaxID=2621505 RepID=UPI003FD295D3
MSDHYYTKNPSIQSDEATWRFRLRDKEFRFTSDSGVFSKNTVDFGSRLLIDSFEYPEGISGPILDVGCGYGPIGLALASAYPNTTVEMVDVNERALSLAKRNAQANQVKNIKIYSSSVYDNVEGTNRFAAIVTNPPIRAGKQTVHQILSEGYAYLLPGGTLTAVIQKKQGAPSAQNKMTEVFGNAEIIARDKGYWIIQSTKESDA